MAPTNETDDTGAGMASIEFDVTALPDDELVAWCLVVEVDRRRVQAQQVKVLCEIERRHLLCSDVHRDARAWVRAAHRLSSAEANAMRRLGRAGRLAGSDWG